MQIKEFGAKSLVAVVLVLFLTAIIFVFSLFNSSDKPIEITLSDVERVISLDERSNILSAENIIITQSSDKFVRGKLTDSGDGVEKDFYLIKIGDMWRVVDITSQPVSCERFARLGFSNVFIPDCKLTFSDAVTLSEIDATLDDFFKSSLNTSLKIIATVQEVIETEDGQIAIINSGEEIIQIKISENDPSIQEGDLIVTTITAPNNQSSNQNPNIVYQSTNPVVVNEEDRDLFSEISQNENNPYLEDKASNRIYKINAPKTSAPPSYFFNVYDVDNSFVDVELDGDF